jgi:glycosyltransferase involved in cell wall biosynthesis
MIAHGLPEERVIEWPYFIREETYHPATGPGQGFLYLGRLSKEKGVMTLLDALESTPGVRLRIAGAGPLAIPLQDRVTRDKLPVRFLGQISGEALHDAIRAARAVIVPSEWYENQPFAILEAFALGVPVIGTAIGGIPELVTDGETGRLVPPGDPRELANAIQALDSDPDAAFAMGKNARGFIERSFGARAAVERMEAMYADLL